MPWYPKAIRKNIPPGTNDPRVTPTQIIDHVAASTTSSLYGWFNGPSGGVESHFYVRADGTVEQYRDTAYQADAQIGGGKNAISIETAGLSDGTWTDAQIAALIELHDWIADTHGIARQACPDPNGGGLGYHSMWGSTRAGTWAADGRTCPGPARIVQWRTVLLPALTQASRTTPTPTLLEDDDMSKLITILTGGQDFMALLIAEKAIPLATPEEAAVAQRIISATPMHDAINAREWDVYASILSRAPGLTADAVAQSVKALVAGPAPVDAASIAAAVVDHVGDGLAKDILDALADRLGAQP